MKRSLLALLVVLPVLGMSSIASAQRYRGGYSGDGDAWSLHDGLTWEASIGLGFAHASATNYGESDFALGYGLGIGGFINPQLAVTLRLAGATFFPSDPNGDGISVSSTFFGVEGQYWYQRHAWVAAGLGFALLRQFSNYDYYEQDDSGFAFDVRAGWTFGNRWRHSYNISIDVTPSFYGDLTVTNVTAQIGYQFL